MCILCKSKYVIEYENRQAGINKLRKKKLTSSMCMSLVQVNEKVLTHGCAFFFVRWVDLVFVSHEIKSKGKHDFNTDS
jgi:hypothetical protein